MKQLIKRSTLLAAGALVIVILVAGCGGGGGSTTRAGTSATRSNLSLTPAGTGDFILVGETGMYLNTRPGAVETPTLLEFTRFPTPIGLAAPVPQGFGFVAAADITTVFSGGVETALAAPVILRVPASRPLPEGRRLVILIAQDTDRVPVFRPLFSGGNQVFGTMRSDGSVEFAAPTLGRFLIATDGS